MLPGPTASPLIMIVLALAACAGDGSPRPHASASVRVEVDPRIELLTVVQALSDYPFLTPFDSPYLQDVRQKFGPFRSHSAVRLYPDLLKVGFGYDAPVKVMLHLSPPPELALLDSIPAELIARAGGAERMGEFIASLRDFAVRSDFSAWFSAWRPIYDSLTHSIATVIRDSVPIGALAPYLDNPAPTYQVLLSPLTLPGGYAAEPRVGMGPRTLFAVLGPAHVDRGRPVFGGAERLTELTLHEFAHSLIDPYSEKHAVQIDSLGRLFEPIRERMTRRGYSTWAVAVREHVVRAVVIRLLAAHRDASEVQTTIRRELDGGFVFVPALAATLTDIESLSGEIDMTRAYARLLDTLSAYLRIPFDRAFYFPFTGTIGSVPSDREALVFVVPTHETDAEAERAIHATVTAFRDWGYAGAPIVSDDSVLTGGFEGRPLWVFGSMEGNSWLAAHCSDFPVRVLPEGIYADSLLKGTSLGVMFTVPSPTARSRGVLVYSAQHPRYVPGLVRVGRESAEYVIVRDSTVLAEGALRQGDARHRMGEGCAAGSRPGGR